MCKLLIFVGRKVNYFYANKLTDDDDDDDDDDNNIFNARSNWWSTRRFIMFSIITKNYNKKTKGLTLMEFFTAIGKMKKFFFDN
jgi:hypothetical protein